MNYGKKAIQTLVLAAMVLTIGCKEEDTTPKPRALKRLVEIGQIDAKSVKLPDGQVFDFQHVINQQFPDALVSTGDYALINKKLFEVTPSADGKSMKMMVADGNQTVMSQMGLAAKKWYASKEAACLVGIPQWKLGGFVDSYEWVAGGGLRLGYSPSGDHDNSASGTVHFDKAELSLSLRAFHPLDEGLEESASINKSQLKTKVGFDITFGQTLVGADFYFQKGLATVTREALQLGIAALRQKTDNQEWYTRVGYREEGRIVIIGGRDVGLQKGDQLTIHNSDYYWDSESEVCDPDHYQGRLDGDPITVGVVDDVGDNISRIIVDDSVLRDQDPMTGSIVKVLKLVQPAPVAP